MGEESAIEKGGSDISTTESLDVVPCTILFSCVCVCVCVCVYSVALSFARATLIYF